MSSEIASVGERGLNRTQLAIAAIGAMATVFAAVVAARIQDGPGPSEAGVIAPQVPPPPRMSAAAQALLEDKRCHPVDPDVPGNESVRIASPDPGAQVDTAPDVRGTAKLVNGEQLYFFTYAPGICMYYFDPWAAVPPAANGSWSVKPNVTANAGGEIVFMAAVVDPAGQSLLREILNADHPDDGPYLHRLPDETRVAHIRVRVRPK